MNRLRAVPDPNLRANGRPGYNRPSSRARAIASVRLRTWSLRKMFRLCPFDSNQGEEKPLADLTIRESLGDESQYF
jgi:hypothetical protein